MNLSDRELHNLQTMYTYYLFREKRIKYFRIGLYVVIGMWLITAIIRKGEHLIGMGIAYLSFYFVVSGVIWLLFSLLARRIEKKRIKMNLSREQFENLIGYDRLTGRMSKHFIKRPWDDL